MLSLVRRRHGSGSNGGDGTQDASPLRPTRHRAGPYRLCLELASGGMASVYLARRDAEHGLGRMVAIKLIHPHLASDREFIDMFMDEAELASRIRHPNVCAVLDYDLRQDESYLVMEYLIGESLMSVSRRLERVANLDPDRLAGCVARILADACEGLHAAHELTDAEGEPLHVVHRDVSLENVFVTYDGVAKVMDFGVAAAANKRHHTRTGMVKGKFASVAPECLKGHKPDRRADLWGIGVIAWELLTGQRLFRRETDVDTLAAVTEAPIVPPSEIRPGLPAALDAIVMRALARDPDERYATARELARDFTRIAARRGQVVTSADVAEWLGELFPGGRERKQQILELAAQFTSLGEESGAQANAQADAPLAAHAMLPPPPASPEPTLPPTSLWRGGTSSAPPAPAPAQGAHRAPPPPPPVARHGNWRLASLVLVSAAAGAIGALLGQAFVGKRWFDAPKAPVAAPAPPPAAPAVVAGSNDSREIVLRIRIEAEGTDARPIAPQPDLAAPAPQAITAQAQDSATRRPLARR